MAGLSREEKQEFLRLARSSKLRKDFRDIEENRRVRLKKKGNNYLDRYIRFLTISNAFINHKPKPFRKIEGNNFKM